MLQVKLPFVDAIHPQSNKFCMSVKNKVTGDSKLNYSPAGKVIIIIWSYSQCIIQLGVNAFLISQLLFFKKIRNWLSCSKVLLEVKEVSKFLHCTIVHSVTFIIDQ